MRVMVLGVTGMLGNAMFRVLSENANLVVYGTARSESSKRYLTCLYELKLDKLEPYDITMVSM